MIVHFYGFKPFWNKTEMDQSKPPLEQNIYINVLAWFCVCVHFLFEILYFGGMWLYIDLPKMSTLWYIDEKLF